MPLRKLCIEDVDGILEWMNDGNIIKCFRMSKSVANVDKIEKFIKNSFDEENKHYAIVDNQNEYQGTISLKNIDKVNNNAEYAIVLRKKAMGKGIARDATISLLNIGFNELGLHKIYLNVLSNNIRAIKFYEKSHFKFEGEFRQHLYINGEYVDLRWYSIIKEEFKNARL